MIHGFKWAVDEGAKTLHLYGYDQGKRVAQYVKGAGESVDGISIGMTNIQVKALKKGSLVSQIQYGKYNDNIIHHTIP